MQVPDGVKSFEDDVIDKNKASETSRKQACTRGLPTTQHLDPVLHGDSATDATNES